MNSSVTLTTHKVRSPNGKRYVYHQLRWFGPDGTRYSENIGRTDKVSKRQAEKLRQAKELQLRAKPGLRSPGRIPALDRFLDTYIESRRAELAPGTIELHEQTARYLKAFFGESRRLDQITRYDAREFKTSLSKAELNHVNKRRHTSMSHQTVDQHIRNARTIFNRALDDDLIQHNPFDRLTGGLPQAQKNWHYVSLEEFTRLLAACPNQGWCTLLALCRLAGLRQGEALALQWRDIDWATNRLTVWAGKAKRRRIVPVAPELLPILRDAFEDASEGEPFVVAGVVHPNVWRDFQVIRKRAGITPYAKWCHTLRKNHESDWIAAGFPFHVVVEWMGHSDEVARQHYLRVNETDLLAATHTPIGHKLTQK
ncbi:MAG: tyrosine-type recombinase/integrase [Phycisphaerae bacterium]